MIKPWDLHLQFPSSTVSHSQPLPPWETLQCLLVGLAKILMESLLCPGTRACEIMYAPSKSGVSFSHSPVELLHLSPAGLQCSGCFSFQHRPQAGEPDVGFGTLISVGDPQQYSYFPVSGSPTYRVWDLLISHEYTSYHLIVASSLSLDVKVAFLVGSSFLSVVAQQLLVVLVFHERRCA